MLNFEEPWQTLQLGSLARPGGPVHGASIRCTDRLHNIASRVAISFAGSPGGMAYVELIALN